MKIPSRFVIAEKIFCKAYNESENLEYALGFTYAKTDVLIEEDRAKDIINELNRMAELTDEDF